MDVYYLATKELSFCYGHRLLNYDGACHQLHGHNARVEIDVASNKLDERGFVIDFKDIKKAVGGWIDENWDHKTLLQKGDPIAAALSYNDTSLIMTSEQFGIVIVDWQPSAENIAAHLLKVCVEVLNLPVVTVRLWETPTSFVSASRPWPGV